MVRQFDDRLLAAARALVRKLDEMSDSQEFRSVFCMSYVHGHNYAGPNWGEELAALKEALGSGTPVRDGRECKLCGAKLVCPSCQKQAGLTPSRLPQGGREDDGQNLRKTTSPVTPEQEEVCGEISLEGSRVCGLRSGHAGPHAFSVARRRRS